MNATKPSLFPDLAPPVFGTHLQTLDGEPLTWAELHAMNEAWHRYQSEERASGFCNGGRHARCTGRMARDLSSNASRVTIECGCSCHATGWEVVRQG